MADDVLSLQDIKVTIAQGQPLIVDERTLGQNCFDFVKRSFVQQAKFVLQNCGIPQAADNYLSCAATFERLFPWDNVDVTITLIDQPIARTGKERHCVLRITIPRGYPVYKYLSQYYSGLDTPRTFADLAIIRNLDNYVQAMSFGDTALVFSSIDYSSALSENIFYPDALKGLFQASEVKAGINFLVTATFDEALENYVGELLGKGPVKTDKGQGVICPGEFGLTFSVRKSMTVDHRMDPFGLEFTGLGMVFPLSRDAVNGTQMFFDGAVIIGRERFICRADFNPYYETLSLSFYQFPSLKQILDLVGNGTQDTYFGEPLTSLLTVKLSRLGIVLDLGDKSVAEISFSAIGEKDVVLIEKIISFKPALEMRIYAPFNEELRAIEGELTGTWKLGDAEFKTALYYPSFNFSAGMAEGQSLDADAVLKHILSGIDLAEPHLSFTTMELYGNFLSKSFSAEIGVDDKSKCAFSIAGRSFGFQIKNMLMAYDNQRVSYAMDGSLVLAGVKVLLSAQYETDQGWMLSGSTAVGETINLSGIANDLLEAMVLPARLPDLKLTDIVFSAAPKGGAYSLSGRTDGAWQLTDKLSLTVERFAVEKWQGLPVTGLLRVALAIGGTDRFGAYTDPFVIRLSAEKAAGANGGWKFEGSSAEGQKIKITEIVNWVGQQFGDTPRLPEAIEGFTVDKLRLSFESESQNFFFTCGGDVTLPGQSSPVQGVVTIDIKNQGKLFTKLFGGSLIFDGMEFDLVFESSRKATGGDSRTFVAAYHDSKGHTVKIDDLLRQVFTEPITTGAELTLKDALFGYRGDQEGPKYLFGLKIGIDIGLAKLPVVGPALPPDLQVRVEDLQILAATRAFRLQEVEDLNSVMPAKVAKLPSGKPDGGDTALQKGLNVSAKLKLGGADKFLMLPASDTSTSAPPPSNIAVSPAPGAAPARVDKAKAAAGISKWFDIQKSLGPLRLERLGVEYKEQRLGFLFDAGMDLLGVRLDLLGLSIGLPLSNPRLEDLAFGLDGLELSVKQKPLEISGALLRVYPTDRDISLQYDGRVLVRAEVFSLAALGSYAVVRDQPSLFIFAVLHKELGGPAFFFVTGLAFGFGVNRLLKLPAIAEVQNFPLIKGATDPEYFGSDATPRTALQKLQEYIPPSVGDYWLAAGVKFNSFGMIDSFAMLSVSFGTQFQIAILGLSRISVPKQLPGAARVDPVACAELAIKVTFTLSTGLLAAEARLTENSFVFSKECKLRGGFALYCWFGPEHTGDFVVTLGGYHPKFVPPAHYPIVPRLGMNWRVSENLALSGELYFALTPSCLMAGGKLSAVYQAGPLRAWFYAGADFLINWQPFTYDIAMGVRIGVSYVLSALDTNQSLTIEIGAQLHMWGPPFGGLATITLYIISFDISFGAPQQPVLEKVGWEAFQQSFLPQAEETGADPLLGTIRITSGLIKTQEVTKNGKKSTRSVVNAHEFSFTTESVVPATSVLLNNKPVEAMGLAPKPVGIRPMDIKALTSVHAVSFETTEPSQNEWAAYLAPTLITKSVPDALWSNNGLTRVDRPGAEMIEAVANGVRVGLRNREPSHGLAPIELAKFKYEHIPQDIAWEEWQPPVPIPAPGDKTLANTIWNNPTVDATRKAILTALGKRDTQIDLRNLAAASTEIFQSEPDMAGLGEPFKQPLYAG